jgi:DNA polymerase III subunit epsilon
MDFIAIDIETADNPRHSICQIGLVTVKNGRTTNEIRYFIQPPENKYNVYNTMIHGINAMLTKTVPPFPEVWNLIKHDISNSLLVAHNAAFDIDCIYKTLAYYRIKPVDLRYECTYALTGENLDCMRQAYGIDLDQHHDSLCDARACAEIYMKILKGEQPDFDRVVRTKKSKYSIFEGHERITGDLLKPDLENGDPESPFFNKKVVFTGVLSSIDRKEAADRIKKFGADIDISITKRTNYVIIGSAPGPSKLEKIENLRAEGYHIEIIYEDKFLEMLKTKGNRSLKDRETQ